MAQHFSKILYATDYSKASARALDEAIALTKQNRAELLVLHIIDPVPPYVAGEDIGGAELYMKLEQTTQQDAETSMEKLMEKLRKLKVNAKSLLLRSRADRQNCQEPESELYSDWNPRADRSFQASHGERRQQSRFDGSLSGSHCPRKIVYGAGIFVTKFHPRYG